MREVVSHYDKLTVKLSWIIPASNTGAQISQCRTIECYQTFKPPSGVTISFKYQSLAASKFYERSYISPMQSN